MVMVVLRLLVEHLGRGCEVVPLWLWVVLGGYGDRRLHVLVGERVHMHLMVVWGQHVLMRQRVNSVLLLVASGRKLNELITAGHGMHRLRRKL